MKYITEYGPVAEVIVEYLSKYVLCPTMKPLCIETYSPPVRIQ